MIDETKRKDDARKFMKRVLRNYLKEDIFSHIKIIKKEYPLADMRDVCLGYVLGIALGKYECHCVLEGIRNGSDGSIKDVDVVMEVLGDYLPRIVEKIEKEFCS
jgi:hypothetical protein